VVQVDTIPLARAIDAVTSALAGRAKVLVATGQFTPREGIARVGVIALDREPPRMRARFDDWLAVDDVARLAHALAEHFDVRMGAWDVMFATPAKFAWTNDGASFELWSLSGLALEADARGAVFHPSGERIERVAIEKVEAYLGDAWVERGVRLRMRDGSERVVASAREPTASWDPTYDGIDVALDASWTVGLAKSLASSLDVPWTKHDALW
jgi:hypothetical protein